MKSFHWLILFLVVFVVLPVGAQVVLNTVQLADVQSNGANLGYFHAAVRPRAWNFKGPAGNAYLDSTNRALVVGANYGVKNADLGFEVAPNGVQIGTLTTRPTCAAAYRGDFFTQQTVNNGTTDAAPSGNSDGGVKDLTYQCCKAAAGTYAWVAGYCN